MSFPRRAAAKTALALLFAGALATPSAGAAVQTAAPSHAFLFSIQGEVVNHVALPPPEGELEDACGVAVDPAGDIYVSDYYHHTIDVYGPDHKYLTQIADPDPDGPCNLAVDAAGDLYVDNWRRDIVRYSPSSFPPTEHTGYAGSTLIDFPIAPGARAAGVFLDPATGDLYVDERIDVAVYGAADLSQPEPQPLRKIGLGSLGQGYGVAVSDFPATEGNLYVPDASTDTVKVFGPAGEALAPIDGVGTPQRGFYSLADSDIAIDQANGHIYVADNLEPGFESPVAAVDEFNPDGAYRGQLPRSIIDAEPTALAVDGTGNVYATSGNSEGAVLFGFGPTVPGHLLEVTKSGAGEGAVTSEPSGIDCGSACAAEYNAGEEVTLTAVPDPGSAFAAWSGCEHPAGVRCTLTMGAEEAVGAEFEALPPQPLSLPMLGAAQAAAVVATPVPAATAPSPVSHPSNRHVKRRHHHKGRGLKAKRGSH